MNDKLSVKSFHLSDHIFIFIILVYFYGFFCWSWLLDVIYNTYWEEMMLRMQNMDWCKLEDAHHRFIFSYICIKIFEDIITRKNGFMTMTFCN
jgi:hypothetical protein